MNINRIIKNKQMRLMTIIVATVVVVVGGLYLVTHHFTGQKPAAAAKGGQGKIAGKEHTTPGEPDLTGGAVTNTFDGAGQGSLLADAQRREKAAADELSGIKKDFAALKAQMAALQNNTQFQQVQQSIDALKQQLQNGLAAGQKGAAATPPGAVTVMPSYPVAPAAPQPGQLDSQTFDLSQWDSKTKDTSFWVPTGAFSDAIIIEGADANASVRGENNLVPMQFKLKGEAHLPGNARLGRLDSCFVTAAAYGDISSERAIVQLQRLSCIINGKHIDQAVKGHVAFYGKNGIKGVPVMRNGKILGLAFTAGALGGLGQSASQVGQTVTGIGATSSLSGGDVARSAVGGGVSKAADKLADYYIERAEQYHPIIPIGAANRVEVVFIEGFRAKFLEDEEAAKAAKKAGSNAAQQDTTTAARGNSGLPPELAGKLGDASRLNLNDFVVPSGARTPHGPAGSQQGVTQ